MPVNRNALLRYTTIDRCLRNRYRKWTLNDLVEACSDALYEYEGIDKGISTRSVQYDIQVMRSDKLGYNAPIKVIDRKYYIYDDPEYSITKLPLSDNDLDKLNDAIEILKQFKEFSHFQDMSSIVQKLENKIYTEQNKSSGIIHIDRNSQLKGLEHLNGLFAAITKERVLIIEYKSFKARQSNRIYLHPYILKEYNNRWFIIGKVHKQGDILNLALDRIISFNETNDIKYKRDEEFDADAFYKNVIGVTVNKNMFPRKIIIRANKRHAPYMITKPIHHTQKLISEDDNGIVISIDVIPNFELEKVLLSFGPDIEVLSPPSLRDRILKLLQSSVSIYNNTI
jgi:predicted DNA-binding transcriptional regulator YafY